MPDRKAGRIKKGALEPCVNPMRKFYELLWVMGLQNADYYDVDLEEQGSKNKPKLTKKVTDFIKLRANEDLLKPQRKILLGLVGAGYEPEKLNISEFLHSRRIFDIAAEAWVRVRIELLTLAKMPPDFIHTELKHLTGKELYSLEEIRTYIYFFWNFRYLDAWEDEYRKPFCDFIHSDKLLSDFYSESVKLFSGETELYNLLLSLNIKDEKGIFRRAILKNKLRQLESNALNAINDKNVEKTILWQRSWISMKKNIEFKDAGNEGIIIPTYTRFNNSAEATENKGQKKKEKKVERKALIDS